MKKTREHTAVLKTLIYSSVFSYPLTKSELSSRLISSKPIAISERTLQELISTNQISQRGKYYVLPGDEKFADLRRQRHEWSDTLWREVPYLLKVLAYIPFIEAVYITGALAVDNVSFAEDDIDLCIVTQSNRLWITRAIVIIFTSVIGKYRLHNYAGKGGWCFNLWLTTDALTIPEEKRTLYTAYEVVQAKSMYGQKDLLLQANPWVTEFLANTKLSEKVTRKTRQSSVFSPLFSFINTVFYHLQLLYMTKRKTIESVSKEYAYFHPRDTNSLVKNSFSKRLKKYHLIPKS